MSWKDRCEDYGNELTYLVSILGREEEFSFDRGILLRQM
jgi:hypothetical protein